MSFKKEVVDNCKIPRYDYGYEEVFYRAINEAMKKSKAWAVNKVKDIRIETKECKICYGVVYCPECHNKRVIHNFLMTEFEIKENELK